MFTLNCNGRLLVIDNPIVMGIINITPDSFYSGSRFADTDKILAAAEKMLNEGATILDIGGQSTRPGAEKISATDELKRIEGPLEAIQSRFPHAFISIDSFYATVAKKAVEAGASIVNDISAGAFDSEMIATVASLHVPYILMHMKGTPQTMQKETVYENVAGEVLDFIIKKQEELKAAGITDIIIDPGFGFAKTIEQNFQLLRDFNVFRILDRPIMAGLSRKSLIYKTLGITASEAVNGTTVLNTIALMNGASILRVHDVKEAVEAIRLWEHCK